jgi:hypothetical protein
VLHRTDEDEATEAAGSRAGRLGRAGQRSGAERYRRAIDAIRGRAIDIRDIDANLGRVAADFHELLDSATRAELRAPTSGTKWTNEQLLFHMLFGFLLVRTLLVVVKGFGRLPNAVSGAFAAVLNAGTRPFHVINYLCALPGGRIMRTRTMERLMDNTIHRLRAGLERESSRTLALAMHFPTGWDPYFNDIMTIADVYDYPTKHYDHHRRQLTTHRASTSQPLQVGLD